MSTKVWVPVRVWCWVTVDLDTKKLESFTTSRIDSLMFVVEDGDFVRLDDDNNVDYDLPLSDEQIAEAIRLVEQERLPALVID